MLTWSDLELQVAEGRLCRWIVYKGQAARAGGRVLYMTPDVQDAVDNRLWPSSDGEKPAHTAERRAAMRAVLKRFVTGKSLNIRRDIKELGSPLDGSTKPDMQGFWEFRSQGRMEETRLFGFFARPGAFVATAFKGRGDFGGGVQADWDLQRDECIAAWHFLFPTNDYMTTPWPVLTKDHLQQYLESSDE